MTQAAFEPRSRETWRDPYSMYAALRDHDPVHHVPDNGEGRDYWVLSRFRHVFDAAVDAASFSSASGLTFAYGEMERLLTPEGELITPKALSPKLVENLEPVAEGARPGETLRDALDRVEAWMIRRALANNGERRARTARKLGITREGLYKKMKRLGVK